MIQPDSSTDEGVKVLLNMTFDWIDAAQQQMEAGTLLGIPHRRSQLGIDDARTDPLQLSHSVNTLVNAAVDQLHAIATLIRRANVLHNSAPSTLARGAIEASATAFWMLEQPTSRAERIRRLLAYQVQDRTDATQAWVSGSSPVDDPQMVAYDQNRAEQIAKVIRLNNIRNPPSRLVSTKVLREVDRATGGGAKIEFHWRLASGFAHGRQWTSLNALTRKLAPLDGVAPGVTRVTLADRKLR